MEFIILLTRFVHLLGFAGLFSSMFLINKSEKKLLPKLFYNSLYVQLITGFILTGLKSDEIYGLKVTIKLGLLIVMLILGLIWRKKNIEKTKFWILKILSITILAIAVFI